MPAKTNLRKLAVTNAKLPILKNWYLSNIDISQNQKLKKWPPARETPRGSRAQTLAP